MRLYTSSTPHDLFRPVDSLRGYSDYIGRYKVDDSDINNVQKLISRFNIESLPDDVVEHFVGNDLMQVSLVFALLKYQNQALSIGLIHAFALRMDITLSSSGFYQILEILHLKKILIVQNLKGVIKYSLQNKEFTNNLFAVEA